MSFRKKTIYILLLGTVVNTASICLAQSPWTTKTNMPTSRHSHRTCVVNGKIYAIGGEATGTGCGSLTSKKVEEYDPVTNSWLTKANMPTSRSSMAVCSVNGKIYAIGGDSVQCEIDRSSIDEYDPLTDTWDSNKSPMSKARSGLACSAVNGKIYAIGGVGLSTGQAALRDVEEYDPITDSWQQKAPMHVARAWFSTAVVDGKIYAFGGGNTGGKTVEVYDPVTDIWTLKADMPNMLGNYSISTVNGLIYIFGGTYANGGPPVSYSWLYNPKTDTWKSVSPLPLGRAAGGACAVNNKIYITGGSSTFWPFNPTSTVFEYNPQSDAYLTEKISGFSSKKEDLKPGLRSSSSKSQAFTINANRLIPDKGPAPQDVRRIVQDKNGFMWFGTDYGLLRYDGYTITTYQHDTDNPYSLSDNFITSIIVSNTGDLWIGTHNGLNRLQPDINKFTIYHSDPDNPNSLDHNWIQSLLEDKSGLLWIGTQHGLSQFNPKTDTFTRYDNLIIDGAFAIAEEPSGVLWFGGVYGLVRYDRENQQSTHYLCDPQYPLYSNYNFVRSLKADKDGVLWVGTYSCLFHSKRDDLGNISFIRDIGKNNKLNNYPDNPVWSIFEDRQGVLWFSAQSGLYRYDRKSDDKPKIVNCQFNPLLPADYQITIGPVFEDNTGILWMAALYGVFKADKRSLLISSYLTDSDDINSLSSGWITSLLEDDKEILWIGTNDGLNRFDRKNNEWKRFYNKPGNINSLSFNNITSMAKDTSGHIWIGTNDEGLNRFDPIKLEWKRYQNYGKPGNLSFQRVHSVYVSSDNTLWVGTWLGILNRYDRQSDTFTHFWHEPGKTNTLSKSESIHSILEDKSGILWIGTDGGGLNRFEQTLNLFTHYKNELGNSASLSNNVINLLYEDHNRALWIGTQNGLNRLNLKEADSNNEQRIFKRYLAGKPINGILEDDAGHLWVSFRGHNSGLSLFNPQTESFTDFGYLFKTRNLRLFHKNKKTGEFFVGGDGVHSFNPAQLTKNKFEPLVVLTDFQIFNKSVSIADSTKKENDTGTDEVYQLEKSITATKKITLSYKEKVFAFEFAALHYADPTKNQYAYKMDGFDDDWNYIGTRRYVSFSNLPAGEYIFRVKASNSDGIWNEDGAALDISITPPWWETNWAYSLYLFLVLALTYGTWRFQNNRLKIRQQLQKEQFETEKLREVDNLKSRFFADISHEFRTPLTLIKGPVKQMLEGEFVGNLKEQYKMILRNSDRLLELINQILDLSKLESSDMGFKISETEIVKYLKGLLFSFTSLAEQKNVTLKFVCKEKNLTGFIDRDKLEKIVTNLLSNAFKFTPESGEILMNADFGMRRNPNSPKRGPSDKFLELNISNTGSGIPSEQLDKILDRFYQAPLAKNTFKNHNTNFHNPMGQTGGNYKKDSEGTGIGLALTKELVEAHHGKISVSSEVISRTNQIKHPPPPVGGSSPLDREESITTFKVLLPIAKENFKADEIVESIPQKYSFIKDVIYEDGHGLSGLAEDLLQTTLKQNKATNGSSPLVLIVEDNPDVTTYICSFLANDYRVITAENGKEGLKKILDKYPDLVISDVMMPEMDGFELCRMIKTDERISHIPVILLTAKADLESKISGLEFGADDYVSKPFEANELQIRTKNLIEQRRKLREKFSQLNYLNPQDLSVTSADEKLLQRLLTVFEEHMGDADFSTEDFAREIGMSRMNLNRKLQAMTNQSTHEFIKTLRLKRAAQLLKETAGNVSEIAYKVGFINISHFAKAFRKLYGLPPSRYNNKEKESPLSS